MALSKEFLKVSKEVKKALEETCNEISLHYSYLHEYSTYVAQLYFGPKKPFSDPQILWGQFPEKGARKVKGKNYALFGTQAFLSEFRLIDAVTIAEHAKKLVSQPLAGMKKKREEQQEGNSKKQKVPSIEMSKEDQAAWKFFTKVLDTEIRGVVLQSVQEAVEEDFQNDTGKVSDNILHSEEKMNEHESDQFAFPSTMSSEANSPAMLRLLISPHDQLDSNLEPRLLFPGQQHTTKQTSELNSNLVPPASFHFQTAAFGDASSFFDTAPPSVSHDGHFHSEPFISNTSAFCQSTCATSPCIPASADGAYLSGPSHFYAPTFHQVHKTFANVPPQMYAARWNPSHQIVGSATPTNQPIQFPGNVARIRAPLPPPEHSTQVSPCANFKQYLQTHKFTKIWGERNPEKAKKLPAGEKGKGPKKVNIPVTSLRTEKFKHRKACAVYEHHFKKLGEGCPTMQLQDVTKDTNLLCDECQVYLHASCHTFYHQFMAKNDYLSLTTCATVFNLTM